MQSRISSGYRKFAGLTTSLLSITVRGGFKVGFIILTISLFTSFIVAVETMSNSYAAEAPVLEAISLPPEVVVSKTAMSNQSVGVEVATIEISHFKTVIVAPDNIEQYLSFHKVRTKIVNLKKNEAIASERLKSLIQGTILEISGHHLNVTDFISDSTQLFLVIVSPETLDDLGIQNVRLYYDKIRSETSLSEAPSASSLVRGVTNEALTPFTITIYLLYIVLSLSCLVQGYNIAHESKRVLAIFSALETSKRTIAPSLIIIATFTSISGVALGSAIGIFSSALASLIVSTVVSLQYIKPALSQLLLYDIGVVFTISFLSLAIGLNRGYANVNRH